MDWPSVFNQGMVLVLCVTLGLLTVCMLLEMLVPRRALSLPLAWRWTNNLSLALVTWSITLLAKHGYLLLLSYRVDLQQIGLMQQLGAGFWLSFLSLLLADQFMSYLIHVAFHRVSWLWPLHAVHHSDTDVDVSSSYRHHPLEPLVFMPVTVLVVMLLGVSPMVMLAYQVTLIAATLFTHSNIYLPPGLDSRLRLLIVTPDFHRLHHRSDRRFTDSNYGSMLPWFDYLFGTATDCDFQDHNTMQLGLEYARERKASRLDRMIVDLPKPPRDR